MSLTREEIVRVAALAEIAVPAADLDQLVADVARIVGYVSQLTEVQDEGAERFVPGPPQTPLRPDRVDPIPLTRPPEAMAPEFAHGFYVVPRLEAMGDG